MHIYALKKTLQRGEQRLLPRRGFCDGDVKIDVRPFVALRFVPSAICGFFGFKYWVRTLFGGAYKRQKRTAENFGPSFFEKHTGYMCQPFFSKFNKNNHVSRVVSDVSTRFGSFLTVTRLSFSEISYQTNMLSTFGATLAQRVQSSINI